MKASQFEYRFRLWIQCLIYALGFIAPWTYLPLWNSGLSAQAKNEPAWLAISTLLYRQGWLTYNSAVIALLVLALIFTALGAWFRTWGTAYIGSAIVASGDMHGNAMLADGPYRHTRNPLYLGTLLHTVGISLLMPPSGAIFAVVLLWIFQVRLVLVEEPFLATRFGQPYVEYTAAVPRFLPTLRPQVPAAGTRPHWLQAILGELYFILAFLVLAVFGWGFDKTMLRRGILISLGVWLIVRAFLPRAKVEL